jgi:hypothetical protein
VKRSPLLRKTALARTSSLLTAKPLERVSALKRTAMKRKPRRPKPGDEPRYKAWVKTQPCCVGGLRCGKADPHHLIDGNGDAGKGMSQTAPDRYLLPMCRVHHELFHAGKGVFAHFDAAQRLTFQEQECERLRAIWADINELGVLQEPLQQAV